MLEAHAMAKRSVSRVPDAEPPAYAARGGWIADRSMTAITYHEKFGQVARVTAVPEMLQ